MWPYLHNFLCLNADFFYSQVRYAIHRPPFQSLVYAKQGKRKLKLDLYRPDQAEGPTPLIIYLHGGGWKVGHRSMLQPALVKQLSRGFALASVTYSFAHHAKWPAQAHEVKAAIRFLRNRATEYNLDPDHFILWGLSAGAHIAGVVGTSSGTDALEGELGERGRSEVQGVLNWYGPTDFLQAGNNGHYAKGHDWFASHLIGENIFKAPEKAVQANPIHFIHPQSPPFFMLHGTNDKVVNPNQSEILHAALLRAGVDSYCKLIPGYVHADPRFNRAEHLRGMEQFLDRICAQTKSKS